MRIGRLSSGLIRREKDWGYEKFSCGCRIVCVGVFYLMWYEKDCKCSDCNKYACICLCPLCKKTFAKCNCEVY